MGRVLIVIVLGGLTYLAGIYRSETLMMLVLLTLLVMAVMFVLSLYQPRKISGCGKRQFSACVHNRAEYFLAAGDEAGSVFEGQEEKNVLLCAGQGMCESADRGAV